MKIYIDKLSRNIKPIGGWEDFYVYALWSDGFIVYIGQTTNIATRISAHVKTKEFDSYSYFRCKDRDEMDYVESLLILKLQPMNNNHAGKGFVSLQQTRERIRELGESFKYNQKYYVNGLKKILERLEIRSEIYKGTTYITREDANVLVDYAKSRGIER